ncbi:MAG: STAS/SEC14 domain-containing protein [Pseudomonadota bacterium]
MIRAGKPNENGVLPVVIDGALSRDDYVEALDKLAAHARERDDLRLLIRVNEIAGVEPAALWEDLKFDLEHADRFVKVAVVADAAAVEWGVKLSDPFFSAEMKTFAPEEEAQAEAWANA